MCWWIAASIPHCCNCWTNRPRPPVDAIAAGVDKVFLTGSAATGTAVLHQLAPHLTPAVMELSGCDAVFVLPGADLDRTVAALAFGLRLNGSATCMAPRRLFLVGDHPELLPALLDQLQEPSSRRAACSALRPNLLICWKTPGAWAAPFS